MLTGGRDGVRYHKGHRVRSYAMFLRCGHVEVMDGDRKGERELLSVLDQEGGWKMEEGDEEEEEDFLGPSWSDCEGVYVMRGGMEICGERWTPCA